MALTTAHPAIRWAVPGAVVAVALGAAAFTAVSADATSTLPPRSAAELLVDVQTASVTALSGTLVQNADLGLPDLSALGGGSSEFSSLISGSHTLRLWYGGEDQQRLALLGTLGESDIVRNGSDVWTWSSEDNSATHYQLPARPEGTGTADAPLTDPSALALTPQQAADRALAAVDPSTAVTVDGTASVAGRDAYELVLTPRADAATGATSLVGQIRIAVDAEQHLPLRVQVWAKDAPAPAFEVGFTQVSFDAPPAEQFQFSPPPGATVEESTLGQGGLADTPGAGLVDPTTVGDPVGPSPTVIGTGWTSVVVATLPAESGPAESGPAESGPAESGPVEPGLAPSETAPSETPGGPPAGRAGGSMDLQSLVGSLPAVSGDWGSGHLLQSALFSVLITDDGRVLAGAVAPEALYSAAAQ
jgi:outer membrane lipoprotein-sorting protein